MEARIEQSCGVIPVSRENGERRFLLVKQTDGHWSFPKGHVESGESFEETARRELFEECGTTPVQFFPEYFFDETYSFVHPVDGARVTKNVRYFIALVDTAQPVVIQREEVLQFRYASHEEAHRLLAFKEAQAVLKAVSELGDSTGAF